MDRTLRIMAARADGALLDLPWHLPLTEWPDDIVAALPRGISRHIVRFVKADGRILAVKEIGESVAVREYELLRDLVRLNAPSVEPLAVISGRTAPDGTPLNAVLITEHLPYSLPYRALFGKQQRPETVRRLIDALSVLMVRLHLLGFFWGDVSLSNTLFRRDAGEFAAYLVDAETGELHETVTDGKRNYDIDVARTNIIGELMDLQAGRHLPTDYDTIEVGNTFAARYQELWDELTQESSFSVDERWRVEERVKRLNDLGFEVGEITMSADPQGTRVSFRPKVVDAGHYSRKIMRLTGMDVQENQARRLINDIEQYRVLAGKWDAPQSIVAHDWMTNVFEPTINAVPVDLLGKLEPAELFHQLLDHRWYISEQVGFDIPMHEAVGSFIENVLRHQRDERSFFGPGELSAASPTGPTAASPTGPSAASPTDLSAATPSDLSASSPGAPSAISPTDASVDDDAPMPRSDSPTNARVRTPVGAVGQRAFHEDASEI